MLARSKLDVLTRTAVLLTIELVTNAVVHARTELGQNRAFSLQAPGVPDA